MHSYNDQSTFLQHTCLWKDLKIIERGCDQKKVLDIIKEAEMKLLEMNKERRNNKNINYKVSLDKTT